MVEGYLNGKQRQVVDGLVAAGGGRGRKGGDCEVRVSDAERGYGHNSPALIVSGARVKHDEIWSLCPIFYVSVLYFINIENAFFS